MCLAHAIALASRPHHRGPPSPLDVPRHHRVYRARESRCAATATTRACHARELRVRCNRHHQGVPCVASRGCGATVGARRARGSRMRRHHRSASCGDCRSASFARIEGALPAKCRRQGRAARARRQPPHLPCSSCLRRSLVYRLVGCRCASARRRNASLPPTSCPRRSHSALPQRPVSRRPQRPEVRRPGTGGGQRR